MASLVIIPIKCTSVLSNKHEITLSNICHKIAPSSKELGSCCVRINGKVLESFMERGMKQGSHYSHQLLIDPLLRQLQSLGLSAC